MHATLRPNGVWQEPVGTETAALPVEINVIHITSPVCEPLLSQTSLPTSPTSPEPVQNENLLWASVSVSEFLLSEREIRWRDPRLPTCQVTNESVWLCLTRSQTGTRSWVWRALTLFCLTHCSTLCSSVTHIVSSFPPSIRPLSFRHSKHD